MLLFLAFPLLTCYTLFFLPPLSIDFCLSLPLAFIVAGTGGSGVIRPCELGVEIRELLHADAAVTEVLRDRGDVGHFELDIELPKCCM